MKTFIALLLLVSAPAFADLPPTSCEDNPVPGTVKVKCAGNTSLVVRSFVNGEAKLWRFQEAGREILYVDSKGIAHAGAGVSADEVARFAFATFQRYEDNARGSMSMYKALDKVADDEALQIVQLQRMLDEALHSLKIKTRELQKLQRLDDHQKRLERKLFETECKISWRNGCP
jgi:hypothetical protein